MTIDELINKVDYTDLTINEPRINKDGRLEDIIFYPLGNIYYNLYNKKSFKLPLGIDEKSKVEEKWFFSKLKEEQIKYAIQFLQIKALEKYIIKNYKTISFKNPFYYLFYTEYPINKNLKETKQIINILINNYDNYHELILNLRIPKKTDKYILELLYSFLPDDDDNLCSICLKTEPKNMLINTCVCKTATHAECLIKLNSYKKLDNCSVCKTKYNVSEPIYRTMSGLVIRDIKYDELYFPYNDLYYQPLINNTEIVKVSGMNRLTMAIVYLQTKRVEELLKDKEIIDGLSNYYFGYDGYKQTPLHALCSGNLYSNAHISFGDNMIKYLKITKLLLDTKKININAKDIFNKTAIDYINENNLNIFKYIGIFNNI